MVRGDLGPEGAQTDPAEGEHRVWVRASCRLTAARQNTECAVIDLCLEKADVSEQPLVCISFIVL